MKYVQFWKFKRTYSLKDFKLKSQNLKQELTNRAIKAESEVDTLNAQLESTKKQLENSRIELAMTKPQQEASNLNELFKSKISSAFEKVGEPSVISVMDIFIKNFQIEFANALLDHAKNNKSD